MRAFSRPVMIEAACLGLMICACGVVQGWSTSMLDCASSGVCAVGSEPSGGCPC
jgi:hypothetical protein